MYYKMRQSPIGIPLTVTSAKNRFCIGKVLHQLNVLLLIIYGMIDFNV